MSNAPHKRRQFTDKEVRQMQKLKEMGWTNEKIAYNYHAPVLEVNQFFEREKTKERNRRETKKFEKKYTLKQRKAIEQGFMDGKTCKQIADETGLPPNQVALYLSNVKIHLVTNKDKLATHKLHGVTKRKHTKRDKIVKIPCPIWECSAYKECKDKDNPEKCVVWRNFFYTNVRMQR